jgi:uncharacterized protein
MLASPKINLRDTSGCSQNPSPITKSRRLEESKSQRPFFRSLLEEIARRFPKLTVIGAHSGNPEYEWAAKVARWNPNVFFDLSGSTLTKMNSRLEEFKKYFWWSGQGEWKTETPANDPSAFIKLVFGSDTGLDGIEGVVSRYRDLFKSCDVPANTQQMIMGRTLSGILRL